MLRLDRPPFLLELTDGELRTSVVEKRRRLEAEAARLRAGRRVLGMRAARKIHWSTLPNGEEMFGRNPTFAAEDRATRRLLGRMRKAFLNAYAAALALFKAGERDVAFPEGTVMMRHRFGVRVAPYGL